MAGEMQKRPEACVAMSVAPPRIQTGYPEPFASRMRLRVKRRLGDVFGLRGFGVNLTRIAPGGMSALRHVHTRQEEFIYILEGTPTLVTDAGDTLLAPGWCAGFLPDGAAHHVVNRSEADVVYLEIGDRSPGDGASYPDDDLQAVCEPDGRYSFRHKDGRPY
jgi:uncharacterized cupin superfamily protein